MIYGATAALFAAMVLMLVRALLGPTHYDRILAANSFGTKTVMFIALAGYVFGRPHFLDIAIAYALINFVTTIALMKFFRYRSLQASLTRNISVEDAGDVD
ncbi:MAG: monovalent cation/H+ antiporter complex subunit F [Hyphomonadaceae bacterium]